jgi:hypothetical protein
MTHVYTEIGQTSYVGATVTAYQYTGHTSYEVLCYEGNHFSKFYCANEDEAINLAKAFVNKQRG